MNPIIVKTYAGILPKKLFDNYVVLTISTMLNHCALSISASISKLKHSTCQKYNKLPGLVIFLVY